MHDGHHHEHLHEHEHSSSAHSHDHGSSAELGRNDPAARAEAIALLRYMADHNKSHTEELAEIAAQFDDATQALINAAVDDYSQGNTMLEQALASIGE